MSFDVANLPANSFGWKIKVITPTEEENLELLNIAEKDVKLYLKGNANYYLEEILRDSISLPVGSKISLFPWDRIMLSLLRPSIWRRING